MFKKNHKKIFFFLLIAFFLMPSLEIKANLGMDDFSTNILLKPKFPSAYETVTATIENYNIDLTNTFIFWYLDGILKKQGLNEREFSFQTKDFSEASIIEVVLKPKQGPVINKKIKILPVEIDLIWEAYTYTYPFYKGKAVNTNESIIKMVALTNFKKEDGTNIPPEELFYTWKNGWKIDEKSSGYGKNSYSFIGPRRSREKIITVTVENKSSGIKTRKSSIIETEKNPEIIFYQKDPLLGILDNKNLSFFPLEENIAEEINIMAYPFYFSPENNEKLKYTWSVDGKEIKQNFEKEFIIRRTPETVGSFKIELEIQDLINFVLSTRERFILTF